MNIEIVALTESYVDQVCILEEEAFSMPWHKESFLEMIQNPNALYLTALYEDKVVGSCGTRNILGEGEITNVVVAKEYRNLHIGRRMLEELLLQGQQMGMESFTLEVRESNAAAIHLYESLGFHIEGIRKNFYERPKENALIMWKR